MPRDRGAGRVYRTNEQPFYLRLASIACARRAGFRLRNPRAGLRGHASFLVRALRPSSNGKRSVTRRSPRPSFFSDGVSIIKDPDPRSARERLRGAGASHQQIPQKAAIYTQRFPGSARGSGHGRAAFRVGSRRPSPATDCPPLAAFRCHPPRMLDLPRWGARRLTGKAGAQSAGFPMVGNSRSMSLSC